MSGDVVIVYQRHGERVDLSNDILSTPVLRRVPYYHAIKVALLLWMQLPRFEASTRCILVHRRWAEIRFRHLALQRARWLIPETIMHLLHRKTPSSVT